MKWRKRVGILWGISLFIIGLWFFLIPFGISSYYLMTDDGLHSPGGSSFAFATHRKLSRRYENYARERVESGQVESLPMWDIAGTEWPLFGSVFYLWATVHLQNSWETDPSLSKQAPKEYSRGAIEAATTLILDEKHAAWVKEHWGDEAYLKTENVFYRMLVMWAIISHYQLTGSDIHLNTLRTQVESFAAELDASPHGLLDDYPRQCYPTDVTAALAAIRQADVILGTDHDAFLRRSLRGFEGPLAQPFGLPPYAANSKTGIRYDGSRGCGNSYFCSFAPIIWPERGEGWYRAYVENFWQENWFATGFREFPRGKTDSHEWYFDVDAGPVLGGFGSAASAFGVAAARTNGDFQKAYSLSAEMVAFSWPLANGTLLLPRAVSDKRHAPHLGEMAILFQISREPFKSVSSQKSLVTIPGCVWILWVVQLLLGGMLGWRGLLRLRRCLL